MQRVRGPFNLSINEECGLLIEGYEYPPYMMMGHAHKYYAKQIEAGGYVKAKDLYAYEVAPDFQATPIMQRLLKNTRKNISVRPLKRKQLKQELELLRDIFNDSWSENWGFTPFTEAEFTDIGEFLTLVIDDGFIQIAEIDGRAVAMVVAIPDVNQAIRDLKGRLFPFGWLKILWRLKVKYPTRGRVMLMGVRKEYQMTRLGPGLAFVVIDSLRQRMTKRGLDMAEMSWILEDNEGMKSLAESFGGNCTSDIGSMSARFDASVSMNVLSTSSPSTRMTAIVLAGQRDGEDALAQHTDAICKAVIKIAGIPMLMRVLETLGSSSSLSNIIISGPSLDAISKLEQLNHRIQEGQIDWMPPQASPSRSAYDVLSKLPLDEQVLLTTADHPLLTSEIVDEFCAASSKTGADLTVGLAPYALVRDEFPAMKKTVLRFRDGEFCGCNLFSFLTPEGREAANYWRES